MYIFLQERSNIKNSELSKDSLSQFEYHCHWIVDLKLPLPGDLISCICRVKTKLWIGTEKGCITHFDLNQISEDFNIDLDKMFFFRSKCKTLNILKFIF